MDPEIFKAAQPDLVGEIGLGQRSIVAGAQGVIPVGREYVDPIEESEQRTEDAASVATCDRAEKHGQVHPDRGSQVPSVTEILGEHRIALYLCDEGGAAAEAKPRISR